MSHRNGEPDRTHFRSERLVQVNGQWFFMCRESDQPIGPFSDRRSVKIGIDMYMKDVDKFSDPTLMYHVYARMNH